jgi:hypothetical protein
MSENDGIIQFVRAYESVAHRMLLPHMVLMPHMVLLPHTVLEGLADCWSGS